MLAVLSRSNGARYTQHLLVTPRYSYYCSLQSIAHVLLVNVRSFPRLFYQGALQTTLLCTTLWPPGGVEFYPAFFLGSFVSVNAPILCNRYGEAGGKSIMALPHGAACETPSREMTTVHNIDASRKCKNSSIDMIGSEV